MAAVVASLAAFVAGCGLPGLPLGYGDDRVSRDHSERDRRAIRSSNVAAADGRPNEAEDSSCEVWCSAHANLVASKIPYDVPEICGDVCKNAANANDERRRVRFDLDRSTYHEVIPYSEVYGVHPKNLRIHRSVPTRQDTETDEAMAEELVYLVDRRKPGSRVDKPRSNRGDDSSDSEDDDELQANRGLRNKAMRVLTGRQTLPAPLLCVICVLCFLLRVFGMQVFEGLLCPANSGCCRYFGASIACSISNTAFSGWA